MLLSQQTVELLNADHIKMAIEPENHCSLAVLDIFDVIGSTNDYLLECAKSGWPSGSVCFAEQQTKGRGRHGRVWFSPRGGSLYCSLLWRFPAYLPALPALSMAVAVMVVRSLKRYGIQAGLGLKWPNDVLFTGRKLGGILLERLPEQDGQIAIVIGLGLNVQFPEGDQLIDREHWIDLAEISGRPNSRNYLAGLLVNELLARMSTYREQGLKAFMGDWQQHDVLAGKAVVIHTALDSISGVMQGINLQGELLLQLQTGEIRQFQCGEVSVRLEKEKF